MLCPKCNTEIPEDCLYCPTCGEEIIIVSDFDIKLEDNIDTTVFQKTNELPDISKELKKHDIEQGQLDDTEQINIEDKEAKDDVKSIVLSRPVIAFTIVFFIVAIVLTIIIVNKVRDYTSYDIQFSKAKEYYDDGDYDRTVKTVKHAINLDENEVKGYVLLSDTYCAINNYDAAIAVLYDALDDNPDLIALYDRIIKCYEAQGDYDSIHKLLENTQDASLMERFASYFPQSPVFSLESGEYSYVDPVVLTADSDGDIYYTTDGSIPDANSFKYEAPVPLVEGENTIKAIFINSKGMCSLISEGIYFIKPDIPPSPVMLTKSGTYNVPNPIGVQEMEGIKYFYTTSADIPTIEDNEYKMPLFMPLGKSEFTFIGINEAGLTSESVYVNYELNFSASIEKSVAEYAITYHLAEIGDTKPGFSYEVKSGYIKDGISYYIVYEMNGKSKTGRIFAVNSSDGSLYWVLPDEDNRTYTLSAI